MTDIRRHRTHEANVVIGSGAIGELAAECQTLGLSRIMVISTPGQAALGQRAAALLGGAAALLWPHARMHVPQRAVDEALVAMQDAEVDALVAIGGGAAIGLAKALALSTGLPIVVVPTTYSGSEMTPLYGITSEGNKRTGRDERVRPRLVLYDPDLTLNLPVGISAASGLNAIAHAVESLWAPDATALSDALALEACRLLAEALPAIQGDAANPAARANALAGSWLAGTCLGTVTMGLHHKLCHFIGGAYDLPHAETHAILIGHVAQLLLPAVPEKSVRLARLLGAADPAHYLMTLPAGLRLPTTLAGLGMPFEGIEATITAVLGASFPNPTVLDRSGLEHLLRAAWGAE